MTTATKRLIQLDLWSDLLDEAALVSVPTFDASSREIAALAHKAVSLIMDAAAKGHPMVVAWSSGKDSTACLNLTMVALKKLAESGKAVPPLVILHADPLVENPAVAAHAKLEMDNIRRYAAEHNINASIHISKPSLASQWAVKVISGRNLPPLPGRPRDCTLDLKVVPMQKLKKKVLKQLNALDFPPVTVIGTRFAESAGRKKRMEGRGETAEGIWKDAEGLKLSPIADWSDDELWQYLYACADSELESYGDFAGLIDLYLAGARETATDSKGHTVPLNTRFGCCVCTVGRDKSLEGMLAKGGKYAYLKPFADLQQFIVNTQFDFDRRTWIGRSINEGFVAIGPDTYSPDMLAELLRYCLTIDVREQESAYVAGLDTPRFQLISAEALIAIDAIWSLQGIHKPFEALRIFRDIYIDGNRYDIPAMPKMKPVSVPEPRYYHVGEGWEALDDFRHQGIRNVILEMVSDPTDGCMGTKQLKDGRTVMDVEMSDAEFTVDEEAAHMILGFELDYLLDRYQNDAFFARTTAYRYYCSMGTLEFAKSQVSSSDMIMRRTAWKESQGLFDMSRDELLARTISQAEFHALTNTAAPEDAVFAAETDQIQFSAAA